ncbi:MAG: uroporphyrinogen-III synthase [Deltaproteobacteria bacterium]
MGKNIKIVVTGENRDLEENIPSGHWDSDVSFQWVQWPVLEFKKLTVSPEVLARVIEKPYEWIIFTSPRAVRFWTETMVEAGLDFPLETQVACIGESTSEVAGGDGYTPDFYPTEPGSEKFLEEFEDLISNNTQKPTVLIPMAEGGRLKIAERLSELGCSVTVVPLYKTQARNNLSSTLPGGSLVDVSVIVFTSPSSVEAVLSSCPLPPTMKVVAIGNFTQEYLSKKGISSHLLPGSSFERIGEVL